MADQKKLKNFLKPGSRNGPVTETHSESSSNQGNFSNFNKTIPGQSNATVNSFSTNAFKLRQTNQREAMQQRERQMAMRYSQVEIP
jgi:hypothetical protein